MIKVFGIEIRSANRAIDFSKYNDGNPIKGLTSMFTGKVGRTPINETTAFSLSAWWSGVKKLSETVAGMPVEVIRKTGANREAVSGHFISKLFNEKMNRFAGGLTGRQIIMAMAVTHGNGYAIISWNPDGTPDEVMNIHNDFVKPYMWDGELHYLVTVGNEKIVVSSRDMFHLKGFGTDPRVGLSAIEAHRQNLGLTRAAQDYGADFYNKGTLIDGYLKYPGKLKDTTKNELANQWTANYSATGERGVAILDGGTEYVRLGMPPADAQFIETRKFQKNEIATILGVPPYMVGDLSNATYSNIEEQGREFLLYSLDPWIKKFEQETQTKLIPYLERNDHTVRMNVNSLLRTDTEKRFKSYDTAFKMGVMSINEIRAKENLNPVDGGDIRFVPLNMIPLEQAPEYYKKLNIDPKEVKKHHEQQKTKK